MRGWAQPVKSFSILKPNKMGGPYSSRMRCIERDPHFEEFKASLGGDRYYRVYSQSEDLNWSLDYAWDKFSKQKEAEAILRAEDPLRQDSLEDEEEVPFRPRPFMIGQYVVTAEEEEAMLKEEAEHGMAFMPGQDRIMFLAWQDCVYMRKKKKAQARADFFEDMTPTAATPL